MKPNGIDEDFNLHGRYAGAISFLKVDWIRNTLTGTCVEAYQSYQHGNQSILPTWERINPTNTRTNQSYEHKNQLILPTQELINPTYTKTNPTLTLHPIYRLCFFYRRRIIIVMERHLS